MSASRHWPASDVRDDGFAKYSSHDTFAPKRPFEVYAVQVVATCMFIGMNGCMIPGVALVTSAANPQLRGTFMTLNSSVQSAAMGVAACVGGLIISRDAQGLVQHFCVNVLAGVVATVLSVVLVGRLKLYSAVPPLAVSATPAKIL